MYEDVIPPTLDERVSVQMNCFQNFEKLYDCKRARSQVVSLYEVGKQDPCVEEWDMFRWCMSAKFLRSHKAFQQMQMRKRNIYHGIDKLPWAYRKSYIEYLHDENRLPQRLHYLVEGRGEDINKPEDVERGEEEVINRPN
ncbi:hypothetical protein AKO1_010726 [Acrasis kona]|uniref:NADH dehydrogenase [ubiquinone] 1 beta subcomplex subunit 10 n=1 Tax=Acrasis kona TaxID=1008807 RepID=A0AAW2YQ01_9EUKA